jgi:TolB-like protein/Flp pilus assembly protein TadD
MRRGRGRAQIGIIHRDLKARNILVTQSGEPKLLDFGIAKLVESGESAFDVTATGRERLTPSSASPEQAKGGRVTAASDVYALGVLLYELLAEQGPYRFSTAHPSREEVVLVVCEQEPPAPSAVVGNAETQHKLRGALDAIVRRATRKDPSERYQSTAELAADVERYLNGDKSVLPATASFRGAHRPVFWRRAAVAAAVLTVLAIGAVFFVGRASWKTASPSQPPAARTEPPAKSVAVLPFENLSAEPENAFFATGVQDAILTVLAKVADLKVLSRASVEQYSNQATRDIGEISRALNVAHVIEGGVQRAGNRVRVTARLVDARTGEQKWAQNYDRELADVFEIQSQIAQTIVAQLQAKLLPREKAAIEVPSTRDAVAYDLYVRARDIVDSYLNAPDAKASLEQAIELLTEATRRDPQFAVAWCYAARAHSIIVGLGLDPDAVHRRQADAAVERAFVLAPELPEAHFAKAELFYRTARLEQAEREIALALPGMPNSAPLHTLAGNAWRRQGRWREAEQIFVKAVELDPKNTNAVTFLADTQILMRRYAEAIATYERALAAGFDPVVFEVRVATIEFMATGRSGRVREALARAPADLDVSGGETPWRIMFALMDRDYDRAAAALASSPRSTFQEIDHSFHYPRSWYEGVIARAAGRSDEARAAFRRALADLGADEKDLRISYRGLTVIGQARAALGEKESAIQYAERAAQAVGIHWNAYDAPLVQQGLAQVYTWTGEHGRALEILERLVRSPGYLNYGQLLHDPAWEPLRGNPRFQALTASLAPGAEAQPFSPAREEVMVVEKSIAVLPFENLSVEPQNAFLAVGVQDAILTDLGKVADLKVLSRASVEQYSDTKSRDLRAISRELNVAHVIEGAVQSAGGRVRVTARLVDARTGEQKWAQQYDRELADVFSMQSQIAQTIVRQLQARLLPSEKAAIEVPPTRDPIAYDLYLRGREMVDSYTNAPDAKASLEQAIGLLTEATQRDPQFVVAWCYAARARMVITALGLAPDRSHARQAEAELERAVALNPELPEVHFAKAELFYRNGGRYEQAEREIALALPGCRTALLCTPSPAMSGADRGAGMRLSRF